jgi:hypothetical protein
MGVFICETLLTVGYVTFFEKPCMTLLLLVIVIFSL